MKKALNLLTVGLVSIAAAVASAKMESVQLTPVALDSSVGCNRIFFQSSQHYKGTIFAVPRIEQGNGVQGGKVYNLNPTSHNGIYELEVHLYFPSSDESLKSFGASSTKVDQKACNFDRVKTNINQDINDPELKIKKISPIPLTSIEMRLPGITAVGVAGKVVEANENADILDYAGKTLTARFTINEAEKKIFESQIVRGTRPSIKLLFQARSRVGSVRARVNLANFTQNFSAAAAVKGLKYLGAGDLSATLKSSVTQNSVEITSEAGGEDISKITNMLVERILKEIDLAMPQVQMNESDRTKAKDEGQISVAAVVSILNSKVSSEISFNLVSAAETASASQEIELKVDKLNDPNLIEVKLSMGYVAPSIGINLRAGETITINPTYYFVENIEYVESREYLSRSEIRSLNLSSIFEELNNPTLILKDIEINGNSYVSGSLKRFGVPTTYEYRWVRTRKVANRKRVDSNVIPANLESLEKQKLFLTFSGLGDARFFALSDFAKGTETPYWKSQYDTGTGRLFITAKQDLGNIRIRDRYREANGVVKSKDPVIIDKVQQLTISIFNNFEYSAPVLVVQDTDAIITQRTVAINVTRPRVMKASELRNIVPPPAASTTTLNPPP